MKTPYPQNRSSERTGEELFTLTPITTDERSTTRPVRPVYIRLPKSGTLCPYSSLSRSVLNSLILGPNAPVKSVSLRKRHALKGTRLIHLQSLLDYLGELNR